MHEEAIPILRDGAAAPASESTPTISRSPWRQQRHVAGVEQIAHHVRALSVAVKPC